MMKSFRRALLVTAAVSPAAVLPVGAAAYAQAAPRSYSIPAQDLGAALQQLATQSGRDVVFNPTLTAGKKSRAVQGTVDAEQALRIMLEGSGLSYTTTSQGFAVRSAAGNAGAAERAASKGEGAENGSNSSDQQAIVVTGSHIAGRGPAGSPMKQYSRKDIEDTGSVTLSEFAAIMTENLGATGAMTYGLSAASQNSGFKQSGNNTFNAAAFNIHGIGPSDTLTLVNGHRLAPAGADGSFTDISTLPIAAIDRVDVLTDGASAIYGADAVAGVVNIVTRQNYDGAQIDLRGSLTSGGGASEFDASQVLGRFWGSGSFMAVADYHTNQALDAAQRSYFPAQGGVQDILPRTRTDSLFLSGHQDLSDQLSLKFDAQVGERVTRDTHSLTSSILSLFTSERDHVTNYSAFGTAEYRFLGNWLADLTVGDSRDRQSLNSSSQEVFPAGGRANLGAESLAITHNQDIDLTTSGSLFSVPAGNVKLALVGSYRRETYDLTSANISSGIATPQKPDSRSRGVTSGAAEIYVPLVDTSNAVPGIARLALSAAVRYDRYSDFGSTTNPKFGLRWDPTRDFDFRASYATSFHPPLLQQLGQTQAYIAENIANPIKGGLTDVLVLQGGSTNLKPETSRSWTVGGDFHPQIVPGLTGSLTYWRLSYSGRISSPPTLTSSIFTDPERAPLITFNPTLPLVQSYFSSPNFGGDLARAGPGGVTAIYDGRLLNVGSTDAAGIDFVVRYSFDAWRGKMSLVSDTGLQLQNQIRLSAVAPVVRLLNTVGEPNRWKSNATAAWSNASVYVGLTVHYIGAYSNIDFTPSQPISDWTTEDFNLRYQFGEHDSSAIRGLLLGLSVANILNTRPPRVNLPAADLLPGQPYLPFDPANANALGRVIRFELRKSW